MTAYQGEAVTEQARNSNEPPMQGASASSQAANDVPPWQQVLNAETTEQRYLRQIRGAVRFIAVMIAIVIIASIDGEIVVGRQLSQLNCRVSQGSC